MWPALIAGGAALAGAAISAGSSSSANRRALAQEKWIAEENFKRQDEAFKYQKELNSLTMSREDRAVQRRVADLKAAGLNPVLAAGDAASSASFRSGTAPQLDSSYIGDYTQRQIEINQRSMDNKIAAVNMALDIARQKADISRSEAETNLINARAKTEDDKRPHNLENMILANSFLKQSMSVDLQKKYADLSATEKENLIRDKKAKLLDKQIDYEDVRYLLGFADYLLKGKTMDKYDKELLVMDSLIKARDMEYDINKWNLDYFMSIGEPTTYRHPTEIKLFEYLFGEGSRNIFADLFGNGYGNLPEWMKDWNDHNLDNYKVKTGREYRNFANTINNLKYVR